MRAEVEHIAGQKPARNPASAARRAQILDAALKCFSQLGYDQTTMADICRRAQASTGSVYHHFQGKEQLAAALYLDGIAQMQRASLAALVDHDDAQSGVRALIDAFLVWVDDNPEHAKLLFSQRHAEFMVTAEPALAAMNREFNTTVSEWIAGHVAGGRLPNVATDIYRSLLIGPSEHYCRNWLAGRTTTSMATARTRLTEAGWAALESLVDRSG